MRKGKIRFCMLAMACFYLIGNYFCTDNPAALEVQMEK